MPTPVQPIWDPRDTPELTAALAERAGPTSEVALVLPAPETDTTEALAVEVLIGLGKPYDAVRRERQTARAWELAQLWMRAEQIRHLVVMDPDRVHQELRPRLGDLGLSMVWEVHRQQRPLGAREPEVMLEAIPAPPANPAELDVSDLDLPDASFLTFRAACRDLHMPNAFSRIDEVYVSAYKTTAAWLNQRLVHAVPTRGQVAGQLRSLTSQAGSPQHLMVQLRAAQAAFFCSGALLAVPHACAQLRDASPTDLPATGLSRAVTRRLRRLVTPRDAAALMLQLAGIPPRDVVGLTIDDVSPNGTVLTVGERALRHRRHVPGHAAALLRAQILDRAANRAASTDLLFVGSRNNNAVRPADIARWTTSAARRAHIWTPQEQLWRLWQREPAAGYNVEVLPLDRPWDDVDTTRTTGPATSGPHGAHRT